MSNVHGLHDDKSDNEEDHENDRFVGGIGERGGGRYVYQRRMIHDQKTNQMLYSYCIQERNPLWGSVTFLGYVPTFRSLTNSIFYQRSCRNAEQ